MALLSLSLESQFQQDLALGIILERKYLIRLYYTYSIKYIAAIDRYLVLGVHENNRGFAILLDSNGLVTARNDDIGPIVRESQSIVREGIGEAKNRRRAGN